MQTNKQILNQLCKNLTLEQFNKGQAIIEEGDESNDKFYIIIHGNVGIYLRKQLNVYQQDETP